MIKTNHNVFFFYWNVFYVETATKRKQNDSIFKSYDFNEIVGNVYNRP